MYRFSTLSTHRLVRAFTVWDSLRLRLERDSRRGMAEADTDAPKREPLNEGDVLRILLGDGVGGSTTSWSPVECLLFVGVPTSVPEAEAEVTDVAGGRGDSSTSSQIESD